MAALVVSSFFCPDCLCFAFCWLPYQLCDLSLFTFPHYLITTLFPFSIASQLVYWKKGYLLSLPWSAGYVESTGKAMDRGGEGMNPCHA